MSTWQIKRFSEVCEIGAGNSAPQQKEFFIKGKYPFFRTSDVGVVHLGEIHDAVDYLNEKGVKKMRLVEHGTLLFPKSGASTFLNHRVIMGIDGYVSSHLATIKANSDILEDRFLFYFSMSLDSRDLLQDQNYPSLRLSDLENVEISFPALAEQRRIVAILDEVFADIVKAKKNVEKNLKNSRELFESYSRSVFDSPKWGRKVLSDVCSRVEYGSSAKSKKEGKIPVLRMGNIQDGRFVWDSLMYSDDADEIAKYSLKQNDVLFNRTNSPELVGKTAIYKGERPAIFAGYLIRIHRKENLIDADYLNYFLNGYSAKEYGKTVAIGSVNQANINGKKLMGYPIPAPSLEEQQEIVRRFDSLSEQTKKLEEIYKKKITLLEELKKSVLKKAFAGEL